MTKIKTFTKGEWVGERWVNVRVSGWAGELLGGWLHPRQSTPRWAGRQRPPSRAPLSRRALTLRARCACCARCAEYKREMSKSFKEMDGKKMGKVGKTAGKALTGAAATGPAAACLIPLLVVGGLLFFPLKVAFKTCASMKKQEEAAAGQQAWDMHETYARQQAQQAQQAAAAAAPPLQLGYAPAAAQAVAVH